MYEEGRHDAELDDDEISKCPPGYAAGPQHPEGYPWNMYHRGYAENFKGVEHICGAACWEGE